MHADDLSEREKVEINIRDESSHLHVQFCGHAMHSGCFDLFYATVIDRAEDQKHLILDTDKGFFQCPFCKKLGNVLMPFTEKRSQMDEEITECLEKSDWDESWIQWMSDSMAKANNSDRCGCDDVTNMQAPSSLKRIYDSLTSPTTPSPQPPQRRKDDCKGENFNSVGLAVNEESDGKQHANPRRGSTSA